MTEHLDNLRSLVGLADLALRTRRDDLQMARYEHLGIRPLDTVTWPSPKGARDRTGRVLSITFAHDHIVKEIVVALFDKNGKLTDKRAILRAVRLGPTESMCAVKAAQMKRTTT